MKQCCDSCSYDINRDVLVIPMGDKIYSILYRLVEEKEITRAQAKAEIMALLNQTV